MDKFTRESIVQMVLGGAMLDGHRIERAIVGLSRSNADQMRLQVVVRDAVREASCGVIPGLAWLSHLLDRAVLTGGVQFHAELLSSPTGGTSRRSASCSRSAWPWRRRRLPPGQA